MRIPISFILFALTDVIFLLQLSPVPGIFMMMLMGMAWSIVTLNGAFLAVFLDVHRGSLKRTWLLLPALWFGGYALSTIASHAQAVWLDWSIAHNNMAKVLPVGADAAPVVVELQRYSNDSIAEKLVTSYPLPVVYETMPGPWGGSRLSWRLGGIDVCQRVQTDKELREAGFYSLAIHDNRKKVAGLCVYRAPEDPPNPRIAVSISEEEKHAFLVSYRLRHITITDPNGQSIELISGDASPLMWLPMPIMGCGLNDAAASWDCGVGFGRQRRRVLGSDHQFSLVPVIAGGLGLAKSSASERRDAIAATPAPSLEAIAAARVQREFADFDKILAESPEKLSSPDAERLAKHPELLAPRADKMVEVLERSAARTRAASRVQSLVAALPLANFQRVGPRVQQIYEQETNRRYHMLGYELLIRLGDVGMAALPTLERYSKAHNGYRNDYIVAAAILGICRIGAPAAAVAPDVVDAVLNDERMKIVGYQAAFVALRRLGRSDLADRIRTRAPFNRSEDFKPWESVTPDSPADVCVDYREAEKNLLGR